jgi:flavin-dependent dehydrogenase
MIGDSARVISPLAGDGIGMAMESAKILSEIISKNTIDESHRENLYLDLETILKKHSIKD